MNSGLEEVHNSATQSENGPEPFVPAMLPADHGEWDNPAAVKTDDTDPRQTEVRTVDITPRGLTTPEGVERVGKATQEFESSVAELANAAVHFFNQYEAELLHCMEMYEGVKDDIAEIRVLIDARLEKQEAFLRAVAGQ
jgi:hypothetical protein